jgi:hypothetical protein
MTLSSRDPSLKSETVWTEKTILLRLSPPQGTRLERFLIRCDEARRDPDDHLDLAREWPDIRGQYLFEYLLEDIPC